MVKDEIPERSSSGNKGMIDVLLRLHTGMPYDITSQIYEIVALNEQDAVVLTRYACENYGLVNSSDEMSVPSQGISIDDLRRMSDKFVDIIEAYAKSLIRQNLDEDQFYSTMWAFVNNSIFSSDMEKKFAFFALLSNPYAPYFRMEPGLKMSNEDWAVTRDRVRRDTLKIAFALRRQYDQRSEQADSVLSVILSHEDRGERAALMAQVIGQRQLGDPSLG